MCGEIDEQAAIGQDLQDQFRVMARKLGVDGQGDPAGVPDTLDTEEGRAAYMQAIFGAGMARAMADISAAEEDQAVDAVACQAIALARLAGFIAGQLPPEADLFRAVISAMTAGHSEPAEMAEAARAHDHHHHHHDHDHPHHH